MFDFRRSAPRGRVLTPLGQLALEFLAWFVVLNLAEAALHH